MLQILQVRLHRAKFVQTKWLTKQVNREYFPIEFIFPLILSDIDISNEVT